MKRFFLSFLTLIASTTVYSQTSVYHPFPAADAYWRENSAGYQCYCCARYQHILSGDTLINSITYQKVTHSGSQYYSSQAGECLFSGAYTHFTYYRGAMRNDISGKKVWFVPADSINEQLLYDFNIEKNDTLQPTYINRINMYGYDHYNVVSIVDSVLVGNVYHKSFGIELSNSPGSIYTHLIEGVGSDFGLFGSMGELMPPFEFGSWLECLSIDGHSVYPETSVECQLITVINQPEQFGKFSIVPNPMQGYAIVHLPDNIKQADFTVIDITGKEVIHCKYIHDNYTFYRDVLPNGIYLYDFRFDGNILATGKLILN